MEKQPSALPDDVRSSERNTSRTISERERLAVDRVRHACVKAPESAILRWVRMIGPEMVLSAKLCDIRAIARAF